MPRSRGMRYAVIVAGRTPCGKRRPTFFIAIDAYRRSREMPIKPDLDAIQKLIARHEGSRATVYVDTAGNPTVGIGFNLNRSNAQAAISAIGVDYDKLRAGVVSLTQAQI